MIDFTDDFPYGPPQGKEGKFQSKIGSCFHRTCSRKGVVVIYDGK